MVSLKNIWIPKFVEDVIEAVFFSVELLDGAILQKDIYSALFLHKLISMIEDSYDDDLIEDINVFFPSIEIIDKDMPSEDIALLIVQADEFYYGFPPINDDYIESKRVEDIANDKIEGMDKEEFLSTFVEKYNIREILNYMSELHDSFLEEHSDQVYDSELSLILMKKNN